MCDLRPIFYTGRSPVLKGDYMEILFIIVALWLMNDAMNGYKAAAGTHRKWCIIRGFIIYRLHGYESSDYDDMHSNSSLAGCDSYIHL